MEKKYPVIDREKTGKRIRQLMDQRGLTVYDIQNFLGFSTQQAVYHWLNGRSLPTIDNLYALSELFGVSMDDIICGNRVYQRIGQTDYDRIFSYLLLIGKNEIRI